MTFSSESLPNRFDYSEAAPRIYKFWEDGEYFHARPDHNRESYSIVIPPPNVTGALHLGHALNNTLQDIMIRMKRMQGFNTLWMPGTDHAGIATQAVVEKRLREEEGLTRHQLGREKLVERIIGDFSFAIWDKSDGSLFCARDHLGVKLFYYAQPKGVRAWRSPA